MQLWKHAKSVLFSLLALSIVGAGAGCGAAEDAVAEGSEGNNPLDAVLRDAEEVGGGQASEAVEDGEDGEVEDEDTGRREAATTKCANGQTLGTMQGRVTRFCKSKTNPVLACSVGLRCSEISRRAQVLANCVQARRDVIVLCFDGKNGRGRADQAHLNQLSFRSNQLRSCLNAEDANVAVGRCVRLPGGRTTDK